MFGNGSTEFACFKATKDYGVQRRWAMSCVVAQQFKGNLKPALAVLSESSFICQARKTEVCNEGPVPDVPAYSLIHI